MSEFKITGPGFYKARDGQKAEVIGRITLVDGLDYPWVGVDRGGRQAAWAENGDWIGGEENARDLIAPWTEPKKGTVWVNVYQTPRPEIVTATYQSEAHAADHARRCEHVGYPVVARFSRNWTEGEGIDV